MPRFIRRRPSSIARAVLSLFALVLWQTSVPAQPASQADLTHASLEDLMNMPVTSVSKKEQRLSGSPAAAFVITREDIRRSGATNIPDLLRMVPGVDVARIDANAWAISIRGFNYRYSTKVLVLIDGRSVYTPNFSGVYWDQQDVPLEEIERIEVIRGPGGTVWGANAVNGVINIITRSSADTQGNLIAAGTGSEESAESLLQHGGTLGSKGTFRVFGRYFKMEDLSYAGGTPGFDGWHGIHGGFRSDINLSPEDHLMLEGDLFGSSEGQTISTPFSNHLGLTYTFNDKVAVASGNVSGRLTHTFADGSEATLQIYYEGYRRLDQAIDRQGSGDVDFQYHFRLGSRNDLVAGGGYRLTSENYTNGYAMSFGSGHRLDNLSNGFIQDEFKLSDSLSFTFGSKLEHNAFTGFEFEPSAQLAWKLGAHQTIWASAARAIRQPSWYDVQTHLDAVTFPLGDGTYGDLRIFGTPSPVAEKLIDFEVGYRTELHRKVSLDLVTFQSLYHDLQNQEPGIPYFDPNTGLLIEPVVLANLAHAHDYGGELSANWDVTDRWRLSPGYSFLQMKVGVDPTSHDTLTPASFGDSPKHQAQLRSTLDLPHHLEWDAAAYYVSTLHIGPVGSYTRVDTRFGWKFGEHTEFSVAGQNLLSPHRLEFADALQVHPTQVERSVLGKVTWRF